MKLSIIIVSVITLVVVLGAVTLGSILTTQSVKRMKKTVSNKTIEMAVTAAQLIDGDLVLYAQWYYGITVTASTVEDLNLSNLTEAFTVKVTGNISQSTLVSLASKITQSKVDITLDLSETQGLVTISPAGGNTSIFKDCKNVFRIKIVVKAF